MVDGISTEEMTKEQVSFSTNLFANAVVRKKGPRFIQLIPNGLG